MSNTFARISTASGYDTALRNIASRQTGLVTQQEHITAGKRVLRASDDPTAAAQAERAVTRQGRIETDQRALEAQRNTIAAAESTLGDAVSALQSFRELAVKAGNGGYNATDRESIAQEMTTLRNQIFAYANQTNSNGLPLFSGLGSGATPFAEAGGSVVFQGLAGQVGSTDVSVPASIDGAAAWMNVPTGNGVFEIAQGAANTGAAWAGTGSVTDPTALTGANYTVTFGADPTTGAATYSVPGANPAIANQPYKDGDAIAFDGMSFVVKGKPATGDTLTIGNSSRSNLFTRMDDAIKGIRDGATNNGVLAHNIAQSLTEIDTGLSRLHAVRGFAGDMLNRVDRISDNQEARSVQLEADRSRAEDLDMIKALSDFKIQETGYSAALSSYAQIQKLSLFNYIG